MKREHIEAAGALVQSAIQASGNEWNSALMTALVTRIADVLSEHDAEIAALRARLAETEKARAEDAEAQAFAANIVLKRAEAAEARVTGQGGVCLHPEHHESPALSDVEIGAIMRGLGEQPLPPCATCKGKGLVMVPMDRGTGEWASRECPDCRKDGGK